MVSSPNGGESWPRGTTAAITWNATNISGTVTIDLYKAGILNRNIGTASASAGSATWTIPADAAAGTDYRVRVTQGSVEDSSNENFAIAAGLPALRPTIGLERTRINFGAVAAGPATSVQAVTLTNLGAGALNWTAVPGQSWLVVAPGVGSGAGTINVSVNAAGLAAGTRQGTISIRDPNATNSPQTLNVTLTVYAAGADRPDRLHRRAGQGRRDSRIRPITGWSIGDSKSVRLELWRDPWTAADPADTFSSGTGHPDCRPDIETIYPRAPQLRRLGYLLDNLLERQATEPARITLAVDRWKSSISAENLFAITPTPLFPLGRSTPGRARRSQDPLMWSSDGR
jgi:hypothetical protein